MGTSPTKYISTRLTTALEAMLTQCALLNWKTSRLTLEHTSIRTDFAARERERNKGVTNATSGIREFQLLTDEGIAQELRRVKK